MTITSASSSVLAPRSVHSRRSCGLRFASTFPPKQSGRWVMATLAAGCGMSWLGRFRLADVRDPSHPLLASGSPDERRRLRLEWRRAEDEQGIVARWPEIPAERLVHSRYWLEDTETGNLYREVFGDPAFCDGVCAYCRRADGSPVMLEPHDPPSRSVLEKRRAAKEQRRIDQAASRKAHYAELREGASQ
jgi:hypothetical protein